MQEMISRRGALAAGLTRYFTGVPCPREHIAERFVSTRGCVECTQANKKTEKAIAKENARRRRRYKIVQPVIDQRNRLWALNNPDAVAAIKKRWAIVNPESRKRAAQTWYRNNHEKALEFFRRRRARLKRASGSHTVEEAQALLVAQDYRCANPYCRADLRRRRGHLDHIEPLTPRDPGQTTGSNGAENLQWLCWPCNASKSNKNWDEWLAGYAQLGKGEASE